MKTTLPLLLMVLLTGCSTAPEKSEWQSTTLSETTIDETRRATADYHRCLDREIRVLQKARIDSRHATDLILQKCESELTPMRAILLAEGVPDSTADRYLKRKRHQAGRKVLQQMMYFDSQRATPRAQQ